MQTLTKFCSALLVSLTLTNCTYVLPIAGEVRASSATRATGRKHESRLAANIIGGIAIDSLVGFFLMVRAYGREQ